jgi:hypothetical protein
VRTASVEIAVIVPYRALSREDERERELHARVEALRGAVDGGDDRFTNLRAVGMGAASSIGFVDAPGGSHPRVPPAQKIRLPN